VESNGLQGAAFAVGWVLTEDGKEVDNGFLRCPIDGEINPWVAENVIPFLPPENCSSAKEMRDLFWDAWLTAKSKEATAWADCGFPVETGFLSVCVADDIHERQWNAPFPLHEIATVFAMAGLDATAKHDRLPDETPHHPTGDARQSARLLQKYFPE
jgi:hypothetical protein